MPEFNPYWFELFERALLAHFAFLRGDITFQRISNAIQVLIENNISTTSDLINYIEDRTASDDIRKKCIEALSWEQNVKHIPILISRLHDESESSDLHDIIIFSARRYEKSRFEKAIIDYLKKGSDTPARYSAIMFLGQMNRNESTQFIFDNYIATDNKDMLVAAVSSIMWGNPHVTDAMIEKLEEIIKDTNTSGHTRGVMIEALGELDRTAQIPFLIELLQDPDADVRYEACWSLHLLSAKEAIPAMQALLDDHRKPIGATQDHPTVAIMAQFAIDFLNDWDDD